MVTTTRPTAAPERNMQGVIVPAESVRPKDFMALTRRHIKTEKVFSYTGQNQETVELLKADILSGITIRFSGQVITANGTGTVATTARWPYDFLKAVKVTANGASNLINVSGLKLKVRDIMKRSDLTDRGVTQTVAGVAKDQGTLARASESWGVGSKSTGIAPATYDIELEWFVPIAEDEIDLAGAIFLATSSTGITLELNLAPKTDLFVLTGTATADLTGSFSIATHKFSIPTADGSIIVPDLSVFHGMIEARVAGALQNGPNEPRLIGQGPGKSLLRLFYQLWNGAGTAAAPLAMTRANFGAQGWAYGSSERPDEFLDGTHLRADQERRYNSDIGAIWGFGCHDFVHENAFRDVVDMGTTSELRLVSTIQNGVVLASPALEYVMETVFSAGQAA